MAMTGNKDDNFYGSNRTARPKNQKMVQGRVAPKATALNSGMRLQSAKPRVARKSNPARDRQTTARTNRVTAENKYLPQGASNVSYGRSNQGLRTPTTLSSGGKVFIPPSSNARSELARTAKLTLASRSLPRSQRRDILRAQKLQQKARDAALSTAQQEQINALSSTVANPANRQNTRSMRDDALYGAEMLYSSFTGEEMEEPEKPARLFGYEDLLEV